LEEKQKLIENAHSVNTAFAAQLYNDNQKTEERKERSRPIHRVSLNVVMNVRY
jgi:hypothetical protein